jgi:hypothetical protein
METDQLPFPGPPTTIPFRSDSRNSTAKTYKRPEYAGDAALYFESPLWLALASGCNSHRNQRTPVIDMTKIRGFGSRGMERQNPTDDLPSVMAAIDSTTEILHITGDVPTNDQWEALGKHFDNVRFLKVAAGWDETWVDDKFSTGRSSCWSLPMPAESASQHLPSCKAESSMSSFSSPPVCDSKDLSPRT